MSLVRHIMVYLVVLAAFLLGACSHNATKVSHSPDSKLSIAQIAPWWRPWVSHLNPNTLLYIEVDSVAGSEPKPESISMLREFLEQNLHKPGRVHIVVDKTIPKELAQKFTIEQLALYSIDGPERGWLPGHSQSYIHILIAARSDVKPSTHSEDLQIAGHAQIVPYPAQVVLWRGESDMLRSTEPYALQHEVGHVLGLVGCAEHMTADSHCGDSDCLMYRTLRVSYFRWLFTGCGVKNRTLCPETKAELVAAAKSDDPGQTLWAGPIAIRQAEGYSVASLPETIILIFGSPEQFESQDLLEFAKSRIGSVDEQHFQPILCIRNDLKLTRPEAEALLDRAERDPYPFLRSYFKKTRTELLQRLAQN